MTEEEMISQIIAKLRIIVSCIELAESRSDAVEFLVLIKPNDEDVPSCDIKLPLHAVPSVLKAVGGEILKDFKDYREFMEKFTKEELDKLDEISPKTTLN